MARAEAEDFFAQIETARFPDGTLHHIIGARPSIDWELNFRHPAIDRPRTAPARGAAADGMLSSLFSSSSQRSTLG